MPRLFRRFSKNKSSDIQIFSHTKTNSLGKSKNRQRTDLDLSENNLEVFKEANCPCCGTLLQFPSNVKRLKCAICQVTTAVSMKVNTEGSHVVDSNDTISQIGRAHV